MKWPCFACINHTIPGRSRKGAWIEIKGRLFNDSCPSRRSRKGAWIEMFDRVWRAVCYLVAPVRERGLKCKCQRPVCSTAGVAPVRERGLKLRSEQHYAEWF